MSAQNCLAYDRSAAERLLVDAVVPSLDHVVRPALPGGPRHLPRRFPERRGKTGRLVFCVLLPFLGVFVCVLARGRNMGPRETDRARAQQQAFDGYVRETARRGEDPPSSVDELAGLSEIRTRGDIMDEESRRAKELVLSGSGAAGASAPDTPPPVADRAGRSRIEAAG